MTAVATTLSSIPAQPGREAHGAIMHHLSADGFVRVVGHGIWAPSYADEHFGALESFQEAIRASGAGVRVLVDLRAAAVQSMETAARVQYWTGRIYGAEDRVAILVGSSLLKAQMRRVSIIARRELFLSEPAAIQWLMA